MNEQKYNKRKRDGLFDINNNNNNILTYINNISRTNLNTNQTLHTNSENNIFDLDLALDINDYMISNELFSVSYNKVQNKRTKYQEQHEQVLPLIQKYNNIYTPEMDVTNYAGNFIRKSNNIDVF